MTYVAFGVRRFTALVIGLVLLATAGFAAAQFLPVPGREYREYHNPVNPVRGEAVVGLSIKPTEADQGKAIVNVLLPAAYSGELRIETASADGRFRGEGVFVGSVKSGKDSEWVELPLPVQSAGAASAPALRPVSPSSLAIAARGDGGRTFLARWGAAALAPATDVSASTSTAGAQKCF